MNTAATATTIADPQATALRNVDLLMHLEGKYRKDLAVYLGRIPQVMSRMMKSGSTWSFNDMYRTAEFLGVPLYEVKKSSAEAVITYGETKVNEGGEE